MWNLDGFRIGKSFRQSSERIERAHVLLESKPITASGIIGSIYSRMIGSFSYRFGPSRHLNWSVDSTSKKGNLVVGHCSSRRQIEFGTELVILVKSSGSWSTMPQPIPTPNLPPKLALVVHLGHPSAQFLTSPATLCNVFLAVSATWSSRGPFGLEESP